MSTPNSARRRLGRLSRSQGIAKALVLPLALAALLTSSAAAQEVHVLAESADGAYQLYTTPAGDVFLNTTPIGNSTTGRWTWYWSQTLQYPNPAPAYIHTKAWAQKLDYFNGHNVTAAPIYGSYTSSLRDIGTHPHAFAVPVANVQYMWNYYEYIYGPGSYSYNYNTFVDAGGRLTPRFTDAQDTQRYGQIYAVLDADTGQFVDFFTDKFSSSAQSYGHDLNYFYYIQSQTYTFTPQSAVSGTTPAVAASSVTVVNNLVGTPDTITVKTLQPGDLVRVYHDAVGLALWGTDTVAADQTSVVISVAQLGTTAGVVYVSVTRPGMLESARTAVGYSAEVTNHAPVANAGPDRTYEATSAAGATVTLDGSGSSDPDHDALTYTWTGPFGAVSGVKPTVQLPVGKNSLTLTVSDGKLTSTDIVVITVVDTTAPVITAPADLVLEATSPAGAVANFTASATDTVSGNVPVTATPTSGSTFPLGTTTVTLSAKDAAGNTAQATFHVTVVDTTPPALTLPADLVLEATGPSGATADYSASAVDLVSGSVPVSYSIAPGSTFPLGTTTVVVTARDAAGNTATGSFHVTVRDTTPPTITLPANLVIEATGPNGAAATFAASAQDLVDGPVAVVLTPASGSIFPLGTTTVTATATDAAGNTATGTFTVTVVDTTPPAIQVPADLVVDSTSAAGAVVTFALSATDLVSGSVPVTPSVASGSTFPIGTRVVTLAATDAAGNTAHGSFTVTVLSPAQQIDVLQELVAALNLPHHDAAALGTKLDAASTSLAHGNNQAATGQLGAFENQVQALVNSGQLSAADAAVLTAKAENIRQQL